MACQAKLLLYLRRLKINKFSQSKATHSLSDLFSVALLMRLASYNFYIKC